MQFWKDQHRQKLVAPENLSVWAEEMREQGKTIATLNGSFDLFHSGHLQILYEASQQADILLVALNTDASIKSYKSPSRPIIPLEERLQVIAALGFVDFVTWFDDTNPINLLEKVCPDIHVNGTEYGESCIEAETVKRCGGKIHIVELLPGLSTSDIIEKIKTL